MDEAVKCADCKWWKRLMDEEPRSEGYCTNLEVKSIVYLRNPPTYNFDEYHRLFDLITDEDWGCADFEGKVT